jgi:hypothetical protein
MNLEIDYRHAPDTPTGPVTKNVFNPATGQFYDNCATSAPGDYVNSPSPVMQATDDDSRDYQNGVPVGNIVGEFNWQGVTGSGSNNTFQANQYESPPFTFTAAPPWTVNNGATYRWQAYGQTEDYTDGIGNGVPHLTGPTTGWCYYTDDTDPPSAPAIASDVYTSGVTSGHVGEPGRFTFSDQANSDNGVNDVAGYYYGIDNPSPSIYVQATGTNPTATVTITPSNNSELDLYVRAVDRAGNVSQGPATEFIIDAGPPNANIATLAWWKLNEGSGNTVADSTGDGNTATLSQSGSSLGCGSSPAPDGYRCTLSLDGSAGQADTGYQVVGNNGPFSASAWVYLNSAGTADQTAISQAAVNVSGFTLDYSGSCGCWSFTMPSSDSTSATVYQATSATPAATGAWTQLTGVFDPTKVNPDPNCTPDVNCIGALSLYVNGALAGRYWGAQPWSQPAPGVLRLGADGAANPQDFWGGQLSGACVFYGALASTDVRTLYAGTSSNPDGCAALDGTYP